MTQLEFLYESQTILIQSNKEEKMRIAFEKFFIKTRIDRNSICFLYHQKVLNSEDSEKKIEDVMNEKDKQTNKMRITAILYEDNDKINSFAKSNTIICPECGEICLIKIEDYKITFCNCKNGHETDNISFEEFVKMQNIDESKIVCDACKQNNKGNSEQNKLYQK